MFNFLFSFSGKIENFRPKAGDCPPPLNPPLIVVHVPSPLQWMMHIHFRFTFLRIFGFDICVVEHFDFILVYPVLSLCKPKCMNRNESMRHMRQFSLILHTDFFLDAILFLLWVFVLKNWNLATGSYTAKFLLHYIIFFKRFGYPYSI